MKTEEVHGGKEVYRKKANREVAGRSESSGVLGPNVEVWVRAGRGKTNIEVFEEKHPKPRTLVRDAFLDQLLPAVKEEVGSLLRWLSG
mmetsp:Transcript_44274/g.76497  ORF Transcript_44274/g.76497 Transcript_44274/m.76497 type:complete len:88 (+) Transcript_44274:159-422(+)